jgi:thioesterase domain-containing protein
LVFVHPGGGNVLCYFDLARCLGSDQPFYALQSAGFYGERALHTRVEDMASHYIEALKEAQPEGPYILGGWSLGGIVAYEMAQQLITEGQTVSQLLLLDTGVPNLWKESLDAENTEGDQLEEDDAILLVELISAFLPISKTDLEPFEGDERINYVLTKAKEAGILPPGFEIVQVRHLLEVYRTNAKAESRYVPQSYPGTITLFKTSRLFFPDQTMGWGKLAAGGVRIVEVPGTHTTMLDEPHVETVALQIKCCLNQAEAIDNRSDEEIVHESR